MTVYLVGAGPGDPGLLTVRGAELLSRADAVVYDRLSIGSLLDLAPATAEHISVGKAPGHVTMSQEDINALLVARGLTGEEVVRLKGGDPFVFARGGEEAEALMAAGVPFEVVPGITSAIGAPAYAGIPVTMRHSSTSFTVITGHEDPDKGGELDWETVAKLGGTIVVLMGIGRLAKIVARLVAGGLSPDTPVAAVQWGTRPEQRTVRATLATISERDLAPPATLVIGSVAAMNLDWFESKPLFGRRIVVTRTRAQSSRLSRLLAANGADPIEVPLIEAAEPADGGVALRVAVERLRAGAYDWLVVTSQNAVTRLVAAWHDARDLRGCQVAVVGTATAATLRREAGIVADLIPPEFVAESLVAAFPSGTGRILLARAAVARDVVPEGLAAKGWSVDVVDAYRTVAVVPTDEQLDVVRTADAVTFTSSSTVDSFVAAVGTEKVPPVVASIGPVTTDAARRHGLRVDVEAETHTVAGLVDALVAHWS